MKAIRLRVTAGAGHVEPVCSQEEFDETCSPQATSPSRIRFAIRGTRLFLHIVRGLVLSVVYPHLDDETQRSILGGWSRKLLAILNVRVRAVGAGPAGEAAPAVGVGPMARREGGVIVANHISWLDVFAVNAVFPTSFVAKSEVRHWPVIGTLCIRARTIFISRSSRADTLRANRAIGERISNGEWVALFPEGTSTDGADVAPFHASLFQSAIDAACPVLPLAIRYHDGAGRIRHDAAYIGDMSFIESLVNVLSCDTLHVTLVFLPRLATAGQLRRKLAAASHSIIRDAVIRTGERGSDRSTVTNL